MNTALIGHGPEPSAPALPGFASLGHDLRLAEDHPLAWVGHHAIPFDASGMFGRFSAILEQLATLPNPQVRMDPMPSPQSLPNVLAPSARASMPTVPTSDHLALHAAMTSASGSRLKSIQATHVSESPSASALPPSPLCPQATTRAATRTEAPTDLPEHTKQPRPTEAPTSQARIWVELGEGSTLAVRVSSSSLSDEDLRRLQREAKRIAGEVGLVLDKLSVNGQDQVTPYVVRAKDMAWH